MTTLDTDKWAHIASELADTLNYYLGERSISATQNVKRDNIVGYRHATAD